MLVERIAAAWGNLGDSGDPYFLGLPLFGYFFLEHSLELLCSRLENDPSGLCFHGTNAIGRKPFCDISDACVHPFVSFVAIQALLRTARREKHKHRPSKT